MSDLELDEPPLVGSTNKFYKILSSILSVYSAFILFITLSIAITLTWIGISQNGFPEFGDPYLGFQTRFTSISNRLVSLENLRLEVNKLQSLENYPGERISEKEFKRRRRRSSSSMCTDFPLEEYGRVAIELKGVTSEKVLSRETLSLICFFQKIILNIPSYQNVCEMDENINCCPMWSLPNYVVQLANKSDCVDIKDDDVEIFKRDLNICNIYYSNSTQNEDCLFRQNKCPKICHHGGIVHSALQFTIDKSFTAKNVSKYSMVILPVPKSSKDQHEIEEFQKTIWNIRGSLPEEVATIAGFDFGGKDSLFRSYLISDLQYVGLASVIIFSVVLVFTKSFFVTVISFGVLILSLGVSYFLYTNVFSIPYFPFMNMLVAIIALGIGTDATLIVSSAWERCKFSKMGATPGDGKERRLYIMIRTIEDTTSTLFITTCTTAGAFLASLTSSITTIRCFSIFAGTAIITSFFLLYICVPVALDLSDRFWTYFKSLLPPPTQSKFISKFYKVFQGSQVFCRNRPRPKLLKCVSSSTVFWVISFVCCTTLLLWSTLVIFISPGFQLPNSEQFQLLTATHPVEIFDRVITPAFDHHNSIPETEEKLTIYLIWGIESTDNGNGLDPNNVGTLQFDPDFNLSHSENQKWMKKLCKRIQKSKFYDPVLNDETGLNLDACFMNTFVGWMKRDCHSYLGNNQTYKPCCNSSKFPYEESTFYQCIGLAARDVYRTPSLYFHPDIAGPKFFQLKQNTLENSTSLATYTVRIRTNVTYSLVYDKMNNIYEDIESTFSEIMQDAPEGLRRGFFVSSHFDFYDLQKSLMEETWSSLLLSIGLCFFFLLVASRSFGIATGAVIAIFTIVTAGLLIKIFNWKLGVFEAIAVTVAVGLSDFTAHHALEFSKEKSVGNMTLPTFFSAVSTVVMGLSLYLFSSVLVYEQIGSFFFVLVVTSWIYSVFFLTPVLLTLEKVKEWCCCFCVGAQTEQTEVDDDVSSHSDLIVENISATRRIPEKKPSHLMMEKWRQLKKYAQETTV